jgi:hypothetical protein
MQGEADSAPSGMEEDDGVIEPLTDDDMPEGGGDVTSDYDPSDVETTFGSLTSSVNDHVWEYGRYVHSGFPSSDMVPGAELDHPGGTMPTATGDTPSRTTRRSSSGSRCGT